MTRVSALGSWPGTDIRQALHTVRDLLHDAQSDRVDAVPHLPELPDRGPGADMVGRTAGLLVDLHVDRQPAGWRLVGRPGKDSARTAALWRQDLDELAEAFDGWTGPLKVQAAGPWTMAATLELTRGERVVSDPGATRDLAASLTEGLALHLADVARLVPGADLVLQLDEPALPAVLAGRLPTRSGYGRLRAVDRQDVGRALADTVAALRSSGSAPGAGEVWVHCCAPDVPVALLRRAGADVISLDTTLVGEAVWEELAEALEAGTRLAAGQVPTAVPTDARSGASTDWRAVADGLIERWTRIGLSRRLLSDVTITPTCGLAGATTEQARRALRLSADAAKAIAEAASA